MNEPRKQTVQSVIQWLCKFPFDATVRAYEGEGAALIVVEYDKDELAVAVEELGVLETSS